MPGTGSEQGALRAKVTLLSAQGLFLGLTAALLIVPTSAIFLANYGSDSLPYTYIVVAVLGAIVSLRISAVLHRVPLVVLAMVTFGLSAAIAAVAWVLLRAIDAVWTSFLLWVLFPLIIQLGFVFIGGQAGRLLDVRQIKRYFPRVVFGFVTGFLLGGLITVPLASRVDTEDLLLLMVAAAVVLTLLFAFSGRRYDDELADAGEERVATPAAAEAKAATWRTLIRDPYVAALLGYQFLSAAGTQIVDFLAFDRAAARYDDADELAEFMASFTVILNLADILFLALFASLLLRRFGVRFGLMANPAVVLVLAFALLIAVPAAGVGSTAFFVLAATTRVADVVFTDGTTRTSVNAAYQAVTPRDRLAVQTGVEGVGVPMALGAVGVMLLILEAVGGGTTAVTITLGIVAVGWTLAGGIVFRGYRSNISIRIRRRQIDPVSLTLDEPIARDVVDSLVESPDPAVVRVGLDLLDDASDNTLSDIIDTLAADPDPRRRAEGLTRMVDEPTTERAELAASLLGAADPGVRSAAGAVVCAAGRCDEACGLLDDPDHAVRVGAAVAMRRSGHAELVRDRLAKWATSQNEAERATAAAILVESLEPVDSEIVCVLCADPDPAIQDAALRALERHPDVDVMDVLLALDFPHSAQPALVGVLAARGTAIRGMVRRALANEEAPWDLPRWRMVRAAGRFDPRTAFEVLSPYIDDADPAVRRTVRRTLAEVGWVGSSDDPILLSSLDHDRSLIRDSLAALVAVELVDPQHLLARALRDAVADQADGLTVVADLTNPEKVAAQARLMIEDDDEGRRAMGFETLEVTFPRDLRAPLAAVLTPDLSAGERLAMLGGEPHELGDAVRSLLSGEGPGSDPWVRACAAWWAYDHPAPELMGLVVSLRDCDDAVVAETAAAVPATD